MKARFIRIGKHFINPAYIVAVNESPDQPGGIRVWLTGNVYDYLDFEGNEARALLAWVTSSSDDLIIRATGAIARQWVTCCRCGDKVPQSDAVSAVGYAQQLTAAGIHHAVGDADVICKQCNVTCFQ